MAQTDFGRVLSRTEVQFKRASDALTQTRLFSEQSNLNAAYEAAFRFEAILEQAVLLARALPAYTGRPKVQEAVDALMEQAIPIEMGYTELGWFCLRIPALLPKKGSGSPVYIQQALYPVMNRFFKGKVPTSYSDCVLIYRHVYDSNRPERAWRDHDNIEQNMVTDIIALYLLPDDAPARCAHFYCSAAGPADRTEVYVVPREQFPTWIYAAFHDRLKEVPLYENRT
jgi:hypothetical protein